MSIAQNEIQFLEGELSKALQQNEFFLEYQPQVSTKTKQIIGFEALIRWKHQNSVSYLLPNLSL